MESNAFSLRDNGPTPRPRPKIYPAHIPEPHPGRPGSISSEDPLANSEPSTRAHSPAKNQPPKTGTTPSPQSTRIAVLLSPGKSQISYNSDFQSKIPDAPIVSDLGSSRARGQLSAEAKPDTAAGSPLPLSSGDQAATPVSGTYRGRGRPKGWKPTKPYNINRENATTAAASRQARQVKPRPPPNGFPKRRGRPPKSALPQQREIYCKLQASFIPFFCEWKGCKAELHNLDTLRRHVYIVHGHHTKCSWAKCALKESPTSLDNDEQFEAHMEECHLIPFSWHVGDGPKNSSTAISKQNEDDIPDYLKDENGNQVTPSVKDQKVEDPATWKYNRQRLKELIRRRDENLPSEEEDEVMEDES